MSAASPGPTPVPDARSVIRDAARRISIAEADPGLVAGLSDRDLAAARRYAGVQLTSVRAGPWDHHALPPISGGFGLLVLDGMFTQERRFGAGVALEIVGPEDLLPPVSEGADGERAARPVTVLRPVTAAVLDETFAQVSARIPGLTTALLARAHNRSERLALHLAIAALPRVEDRLLGLLSLLSERFGQVGADGVHLTLPLTHAVLGLLIGARRPTVTLAVTALRERGELARMEGGGWLLPQAGARMEGAA